MGGSCKMLVGASDDFKSASESARRQQVLPVLFSTTLRDMFISHDLNDAALCLIGCAADLFHAVLCTSS